MPRGSGALPLRIREDWVPQVLSVLDDDSRFVIQLENKKQGIEASYALFPNTTGTPTSAGCRDAVIQPILQNLKSNATVTGEHLSTQKTDTGVALAVESFMIVKVDTTPIQQKNVFGFLGDAHTCAEIHLSKVQYQPSDEVNLNSVLDSFAPELSYVPKAADYGVVATIFFTYIRDYKDATIYYQRALESLPPSQLSAPDASIMGRMTVVQLALSYGMTGDLKRSREVSEAAVARDPDFPVYYYSLACVDAEEGNAAAARTHLEQAFARRANMPQGLSLPDPSQDVSIQKLKGDPDFWAFVQSLPKK